MKKFKWFLKTIGILVLINVITAVLAYALNLLGLSLDTERSITYMLLLSQSVIAIITYLLVRRGNTIDKQGLKKDSWKMLILGLGAAGLGNIILSFVIQMLGDNTLVQNSIDLVETVFNVSDSFAIILQAISVVIIAPIVEEYLFRGYIFTECRKVFKPGLAIFLNGLLFGIYHMNLLQGINTFVLGMLLALIYYYRRNITDVILVHAANNSIALISTFIPQAASIIGVILIISLIISFYIIYKMVKNGRKSYNLENEI